MSRVNEWSTSPSLAVPPAIDDVAEMQRLTWPATQRADPIAGLKGSIVGRYAVERPVLAPGSRVGILCDTLHADPDFDLDLPRALSTAAELIEKLGYVPVIDAVHAAQGPYHGRWAGDARSRGAHFVRLVDTLGVDAVFPLFGKGGGHDIIGEVLASGCRPRRPIVLIGGFSHHTDWSLFAVSPLGHGFFSHVLNVTQGAYWKLLPQENVENLRAVLHRARSVQYEHLGRLNPNVEVPGGSVRGPLVGGNMGAVLLSMHRTWMPSFRGTIALCEDYDKHPHDFHRGFIAFASLVVNAGARAIVVGSMLPIRKLAHQKLEPEARRAVAALERQEIADAIGEVAAGLPIPVFHAPELFGHGALNCPLGLGGETRVRLEADGAATLVNDLAMAVRYQGSRP